MRYAKAAYKHAVEEFLEENLGKNIDQALDNSGCKDDIRSVVMLTDQDLGQLMHKESAGPDKKDGASKSGFKEPPTLLKGILCL